MMEEHILPALRTYLTDVFAGLTADQADGMWFEVRNGAGYEPPQVSALYRGLDAVLNELATKFDKDITGLLIALIGTQSAGGVHDWMQH
ncbi:hypothetical protein ABWL39_19865 [Chitinivorax sp. PXF-14]|uniref:hypothetical protein n=1 Tax=Chitinivorax sp. PXF-14 TaxID=3230488 RepID=UPI003464F237